MATEEVNVKFLSDTRDYVAGQDRAEDATDDLTRSIIAQDDAQDNLTNQTRTTTTATEGLNRSFDSTAAGAIDAQLGVSGFGDAVVQTGRSAIASLRSLSAFNTAMLITIGGAVIAGLALILVYWEDIASAIDTATRRLALYELEISKLNSLSIEFNENLELTIAIMKAAGATEEQIRTRRIELLSLEAQRLQDNIDAANAELENFDTEIPLSFERIRFLATVITSSREGLASIGQVLAILMTEAAFNVEELIGGLTRATDRALTLSDVLGDTIINLRDLPDAEIDAYILKWEELADVVNDSYKNQLLIDNQLAQQRIANIALAFGAANSFVQENNELSATLAIGQATANAAVAVMQAVATYPPGTPSSVLLAPSIAAIGLILATQIGNITSALGTGSVGQGIGSTPVSSVTRDTVETALPGNLRPGFTPVLVTSDFNRVDGRVRVVNDRGSLS